ncbi:MAG: hypothetical protein JO089_03405 [Alphaproteobacteria bacterium]|nr:hypothetical protein [Alphaproteobacteria bacterium]
MPMKDTPVNDLTDYQSDPTLAFARYLNVNDAQTADEFQQQLAALYDNATDRTRIGQQIAGGSSYCSAMLNPSQYTLAPPLDPIRITTYRRAVAENCANQYIALRSAPPWYIFEPGGSTLAEFVTNGGNPLDLIPAYCQPLIRGDLALDLERGANLKPRDTSMVTVAYTHDYLLNQHEYDIAGYLIGRPASSDPSNPDPGVSGAFSDTLITGNASPFLQYFYIPPANQPTPAQIQQMAVLMQDADLPCVVNADSPPSPQPAPNPVPSPNPPPPPPSPYPYVFPSPSPYLSPEPVPNAAPYPPPQPCVPPGYFSAPSPPPPGTTTCSTGSALNFGSSGFCSPPPSSTPSPAAISSTQSIAPPPPVAMPSPSPGDCTTFFGAAPAISYNPPPPKKYYCPNVERIVDAADLYGPRQDFHQTDRDYSPLTSVPVKYQNPQTNQCVSLDYAYSKFADPSAFTDDDRKYKPEVRCAVVPVDIMTFRYPLWNREIMARIDKNLDAFILYEIGAPGSDAKAGYSGGDDSLYVDGFKPPCSTKYDVQEADNGALCLGPLLSPAGVNPSPGPSPAVSIPNPPAPTMSIQELCAYAAKPVVMINQLKIRTDQGAREKFEDPNPGPIVEPFLAPGLGGGLEGDVAAVAPRADAAMNAVKNDYPAEAAFRNQSWAQSFYTKEGLFVGYNMPYIRWWDTGAAAGMRHQGASFLNTLGSFDYVVGVGREGITTAEASDAAKYLSGGSTRYKADARPSQARKLGGFDSLKETQALTFRHTGLYCLPRYEKTLKGMDNDEYMLNAGGAPYNALDEAEKQVPQQWPLAWRGYGTDESITTGFPYLNNPNLMNLPSAIATGLDNATPGSIILLTVSNLPQLYYVYEVGCHIGNDLVPNVRCSDRGSGTSRDYIKVSSMSGKNLSSVGLSMDNIGVPINQTIFRTTINDQYFHDKLNSTFPKPMLNDEPLCTDPYLMKCTLGQAAWDQALVYQPYQDVRVCYGLCGGTAPCEDYSLYDDVPEAGDQRQVTALTLEGSRNCTPPDDTSTQAWATRGGLKLFSAYASNPDKCAMQPNDTGSYPASLESYCINNNSPPADPPLLWRQFGGYGINQSAGAITNGAPCGAYFWGTCPSGNPQWQNGDPVFPAPQ